MFKRHKKDIAGWIIMAPSIILFVFFLWEPLLASVVMSFYSAKGIRLERFVGFQNYIEVVQHPDFKAAFFNTFSYTFWSLVIGFLVPIILAIIINEIIHFKGFFRVSVYLPNVIPGLAVAIMWLYIYRAGKTGLLNILLGKLGFPPQAWLTKSHLVIPLIVLFMTWRSAGATTLIYLARLQGIDPELYEAATIDGAGIWARLKYITLPQIYNLARTLLILQIIFVFQVLYEPLVLTNGGPNNASTTLMLLVYKYAFEKFDYPKAASISVIIALILLLLTTVYNRLVKVNEE
ncbi:MAG: sugar ABC transporter permease [Dictyoglomus thermophilum]|uniref:Sugar ABC transporter permease n=1 Tax=Dictyoglomus thermophilum TaxID=14 RepID=A0A7V3ZK96_DICTH|nr:sugar ABC transporter permease [Dictyoglomus thermophilum]MCX7720748.1 sugar ABC transporter permease [Dictyoglomus thermophilum]TYT24117.1 sugar ABC transporter permease [Dictyoglomus thermophilum]